MPHVGRCAGEPYAAVCGCLILSSYLVLFIMFYIATYKKASARKAKKGQSVDKKDGVSAVKQSATKVASGTLAHSVTPMAEK